MSKQTAISVEDVYKALEQVLDPEIPALTVVDLGIITNVSINESNEAHIVMTPTFVGCPALDVMKKQINEVAVNLGFDKVEVSVDFTIPWDSNRISDEGREKLENFGLPAPAKHNGEVDEALLAKVKCPHCSSTDTTLNSPFGSTLCRAIRFCYSCKQGFEQFKPI